MKSSLRLLSISALLSLLVACSPEDGGVTAPPDNPIPLLSAIGPASRLIGETAFTLTLTGSNFLPVSVVRWNGLARPTSFASPTQLTAQISAADLSVASFAEVTVSNPAPGGGVSDPRQFIVMAGLPGLHAVAGSGQEMFAGEAYPTLLEAVLRNASGQPASDVAIRFQGEGTGLWVGGSGWPPRTDAEGKVTVRWYAPSNGATDFVVTAKVEGASGFSPDSIAFTLAVTPPPGLHVISGDGQVAAPGAAYPIHLETVLRDSLGQPASNIAVRYTGLGTATEIGSGGWPPRTDSAGRVRLRWIAPSDGTTSFEVIARVEDATGFSPDSVRFQLSVEAPPVATTGARIWLPQDFTGDSISFNLEPASSGTSVLFVVPNLTSLDWWNSTLSVSDSTYVRVSAAPGATGTPGRTLSVPTSPVRADWTSPAGTATSSPAATRNFQVYSNVSGTYVSAQGNLAHTGPRFVYYEDVANTTNFSAAQYAQLDSVTMLQVPRLDSLLGPPSDLDGNGRIAVFISATASQVRSGGEAYVDGCNFNPAGTGCGGVGEVIYFVAPNHFGSQWVANPAFYVTNYYPRNILHEAIHVLQYAHSYRRSGAFVAWRAPALYYEGLAEVNRLESRLGYQETWNLLRTRFTNGELRGPFQDPYYAGAALHWWLLRRLGDGYPQAIVDAMYTAILGGQDVFERAIGVKEPELLAMYYASLFLDESPFGALVGLEVLGENIPALLSNVSLPSVTLEAGDQASAMLQYSEGRIFAITHAQAVRVTIRNSRKAAVLVAQP